VSRRAAWLATLLLWGCDEPAPESCAETGVCAPGEVCDRATGVCRPAEPSPLEYGDVGRFLSAEAADDGSLHLAARAESPGALVAGRVLPGSMEVELRQVVAGAAVALGADIALGPDGRPRIAFFDADAGALRLATFNGTNWVVERVDAGTPELPVGRYPALGFAEGEVVAYRDAAAGGLRVAVRRGRGWDVQLVDAPEDGPGPGGGRGFSTTLAVAGGRPIVAHHDRDAGTLRVVVPEETGWAVRVFPEPGEESATPDWGPFVSTAVDPWGNVGLAWADGRLGRLMVAWNERGSLRLETADDGVGTDREPARLVGAFCSLAFDPDGRPAVAYQDGASAALRMARLGDAGWSSEPLSEEPVSGQGIVLARPPGEGLVAVHRRVQIDVRGEVTGQLHVVRP